MVFIYVCTHTYLHKQSLLLLCMFKGNSSCRATNKNTILILKNANEPSILPLSYEPHSRLSTWICWTCLVKSVIAVMFPSCDSHTLLRCEKGPLVEHKILISTFSNRSRSLKAVCRIWQQMWLPCIRDLHLRLIKTRYNHNDSQIINLMYYTTLKVD